MKFRPKSNNKKAIKIANHRAKKPIMIPSRLNHDEKINIKKIKKIKLECQLRKLDKAKREHIPKLLKMMEILLLQ